MGLKGGYALPAAGSAVLDFVQDELTVEHYSSSSGPSSGSSAFVQNSGQMPWLKRVFVCRLSSLRSTDVRLGDFVEGKLEE